MDIVEEKLLTAGMESEEFWEAIGSLIETMEKGRPLPPDVVNKTAYVGKLKGLVARREWTDESVDQFILRFGTCFAAMILCSRLTVDHGVIATDRLTNQVKAHAAANCQICFTILDLERRYRGSGPKQR